MAPPVPKAAGSPSPAWPLAHASRRITRDFGNARTGSARSPRPGAPRYHVAEDLRAHSGTVILAPEQGTVVVIRDKFYQGTGVMLLQLDSGLVVALGEIEPGSADDFAVVVGSRVARGQPVARVGRLGMLHFETYREGTRTTHQWWVGDPPPPALLDPTNYLRSAAGAPLAPVGPVTPAHVPVPVPVPTIDPEPVTIPSAPSSAGGWVLAALVVAAVALS